MLPLVGLVGVARVRSAHDPQARPRPTGGPTPASPRAWPRPRSGCRPQLTAGAGPPAPARTARPSSRRPVPNRCPSRPPSPRPGLKRYSSRPVRPPRPEQLAPDRSNDVEAKGPRWADARTGPARPPRRAPPGAGGPCGGRPGVRSPSPPGHPRRPSHTPGRTGGASTTDGRDAVRRTRHSTDRRRRVRDRVDRCHSGRSWHLPGRLNRASGASSDPEAGLNQRERERPCRGHPQHPGRAVRQPRDDGHLRAGEQSPSRTASLVGRAPGAGRPRCAGPSGGDRRLSGDGRRHRPRLDPAQRRGAQARREARIDEFNALAGHEQIHKGLTSRDVTENVEQLQVRQAIDLVESRPSPSWLASPIVPPSTPRWRWSAAPTTCRRNR